MKIARSNVSMASNHVLESRTETKQASLEVRAEFGAMAKAAVAAIYDGSDKSAVSAMEELQKDEKLVGTFQNGIFGASPDRLPHGPFHAADLRLAGLGELHAKTLSSLLDLLFGTTRGDRFCLAGRGDILDLRGGAARTAGALSRLFGVSALGFPGAPGAGVSSSGTLWQRVNAVSTEKTEREYTAFQSKGCAVTADGRSISFDVEFSLSRSLTRRFDALSSETFILTDPLVINLETDVTSVSGAKFRFDLDSDGKKEEISFAGRGSGFLALDKNGNGTIDDGSELFGTKSGNGFADLAAYDGDGNGWIDENDDVYDKLRVWVRDEDGGDRLLDLKKANVGAIYLGSADTEFSFKDAETDRTDGVLRRTGIYLRENGGAGTLSHVDLSC